MHRSKEGGSFLRAAAAEVRPLQLCSRSCPGPTLDTQPSWVTRPPDAALGNAVTQQQPYHAPALAAHQAAAGSLSRLGKALSARLRAHQTTMLRACSTSQPPNETMTAGYHTEKDLL